MIVTDHDVYTVDQNEEITYNFLNFKDTAISNDLNMSKRAVLLYCIFRELLIF